MSEETKRKRVKYLTRSVKYTDVTAMCLDLTTAEPHTNCFELEGKFKSEEKMLLELRKQHDTEMFKVVAITSTAEKEKLMGMPMDMFLSHAIAFDPLTRQPLLENEE